MTTWLNSMGIHPRTLFRVFKYTIYTLLLYNVFLFFKLDLAASAQTFGEDVSWRNVVEAYSATIDTAAWLLLLLLFELETAVIDDAQLRGGLKWLLTGVRAVCYFFIVYAFYGYGFKYAFMSDLKPFFVDDPCSLIGSGFTWVAGLDDYRPFDALSCQALQGAELLRVEGTDIIGTAAAFEAALRMAMVDIVNAADWLIIVALLEIEVFLQIRGRLRRGAMTASKYAKGVLYSILFAAAAYWGIKGDFLDFWDAFLWLVAFIFIEMNIFQWHEETEGQRAASEGRG